MTDTEDSHRLPKALIALGGLMFVEWFNRYTRDPEEQAKQEIRLKAFEHLPKQLRGTSVPNETKAAFLWFRKHKSPWVTNICALSHWRYCSPLNLDMVLIKLRHIAWCHRKQHQHGRMLQSREYGDLRVSVSEFFWYKHEFESEAIQSLRSFGQRRWQQIVKRERTARGLDENDQKITENTAQNPQPSVLEQESKYAASTDTTTQTEASVGDTSTVIPPTTSNVGDNTNKVDNDDIYDPMDPFAGVLPRVRKIIEGIQSDSETIGNWVTKMKREIDSKYVTAPYLNMY